MKASLHLVKESMLFLGKDYNQSLALPLKEKGNNLSLIISPSTSLYFAYHKVQQSYLGEQQQQHQY